MDFNIRYYGESWRNPRLKKLFLSSGKIYISRKIVTQVDEPSSSGNFDYDLGDLYLARGSQDPNATAGFNPETEDAGAREMAEDSKFDRGDFDLLKGCQDTGVEEVGKCEVERFCRGQCENVDLWFQGITALLELRGKVRE